MRFYPPILTGLQAAPPFDISGSIPVLSRPATAKVEVVDAQPKALRITPSAASPLAPGQTVALTVEQQVGDSDAWQEVRPDAVEWNVPPQVILDAAHGKPAADGHPAARSAGRSEARRHGRRQHGLGGLHLESKPGPTPRIRRPAWCWIASRAENSCPSARASGTRSWSRRTGIRNRPPTCIGRKNFENEYVKWEAPVLTAKQEGYTQFLRAEVGGRSVLWHTTTYRPGEFAIDPPADGQKRSPTGSRSSASRDSQQVQQVRFAGGGHVHRFQGRGPLSRRLHPFRHEEGPSAHARTGVQRDPDRRARRACRPPPRLDQRHCRVPGHVVERSP